MITMKKILVALAMIMAVAGYSQDSLIYDDKYYDPNAVEVYDDHHDPRTCNICNHPDRDRWEQNRSRRYPRVRVNVGGVFRVPGGSVWVQSQPNPRGWYNNSDARYFSQHRGTRSGGYGMPDYYDRLYHDIYRNDRDAAVRNSIINHRIAHWEMYWNHPHFHHN